MYIKDSLERQFYAHLCGMEHWDTRTLLKLRIEHFVMELMPSCIEEKCVTLQTK